MDKLKLTPDHPQRTNIAPQGLFHTPEDWQELQSWLDAHPREDRAHLYTAAVMAWNLAAKLAEGRVATVLQLRAPNDVNGNPRRVWVAVDPDSGDELAVAVDDYDGPQACRERLREALPDGWILGSGGVFLDVPAAEFERRDR